MSNALETFARASSSSMSAAGKLLALAPVVVVVWLVVLKLSQLVQSLGLAQ